MISIGEIYKCHSWDYLYVITDWGVGYQYAEGSYLCLNLSKEVDEKVYFSHSLGQAIGRKFKINPYELPYRLQVHHCSLMDYIEPGRGTRFLMSQVLRTKINFPTLFQ